MSLLDEAQLSMEVEPQVPGRHFDNELVMWRHPTSLTGCLPVFMSLTV